MRAAVVACPDMSRDHGCVDGVESECGPDSCLRDLTPQHQRVACHGCMANMRGWWDFNVGLSYFRLDVVREHRSWS